VSEEIPVLMLLLRKVQIGVTLTLLKTSLYFCADSEGEVRLLKSITSQFVVMLVGSLAFAYFHPVCWDG
jgi:hypothetical protein